VSRRGWASVVRDLEERHPVREPQHDEPRVRAVQEAEAVLAALDAQARLHLPVRDPEVGEKPVDLERVEEQRAVGVDGAVLMDHRDVELRPGERAPRDEPVLEVVRPEVEGGEPPVDVAAGDVLGVVVVPERRERVGRRRPRAGWGSSSP
jgi:hypothetical protein